MSISNCTHLSEREEAQEHIKSIRKEKFGIDDQNNVLATNTLRKDLKNAINHLSEGLYSEDIHFIFELIQNAEDNIYSDGVEPYLSFQLLEDDPTNTPESEGALIITNNEIGLRREDVEALCSVGESTKDKQQGYIGEKGIGFKSVFKVSVEPHVYSRGYSFSFPQVDPNTKLGFIVPYWKEHAPNDNKTVIILPLKEGKKEEIKKKLLIIAPETILFLRKIKRIDIKIYDETDRRIIRDNAQFPIVSISYSVKDGGKEEAISHKYWIETKNYSKPNNIIAEKRCNISNRDVTIAIPLSDCEKMAGKVFAYLPLRINSELPFIVNADFLLTSSRETMKEDDEWNRWLCNCVGPTFEAAFLKLIHNEEYKYEAYKYIPLTKNMKDSLFISTAEDIVTRLSKHEIVWTEYNGVPVCPDKCIILNKRFQDLINPQKIPSHFKEIKPVKHTIAKYDKQLKYLGVLSFNEDCLKVCLSDSEWLSNNDLDWYVKLYSYLQKEIFRKEFSDTLKSFKIIPIQNGSLSCDSEQPIYFTKEDKAREFLSQVPKIVSPKIQFLQERLYDIIKDKHDIVQWMTKDLAVYSFNISNYCIDVANKMDDSVDSLTDSELITATRFLAIHSETKYDNMPILLKSGVRIRLEDINKESSPYKYLVLPESLSQETGWADIFESEEDRIHLAVLSDKYTDSNGIDVPLDTLIGYLSKLGATSIPLPRTQRVNYYDNKSEYAEGVFSQYKNQAASSWYNKSWLENKTPFNWLQKLYLNQPVKELDKKSTSLLKWMEEIANDKSNPTPNMLSRLNSKFLFQYNGLKYISIESEFIIYLKKMPWLATTKGFVVPKRAFLDEPAIKEILGDTGSYVNTKISPEITKLLGVCSEITASDLINYLKGLSANTDDDINLVRKIYKYLSNYCADKKIIRDAFHSHPLIYIPIGSNRWFMPEEVIWNDRSSIVGDEFAYIEIHYPDLKEFFVDTICIKIDLDAECYANKWLSLSNSGNVGCERLEELLPLIYRSIVKVYDEEVVNDNAPEWWDGFIKNVKIWTQQNTFSPTNDVFIPDDSFLRNIFAKHNIKYVWRPDKSSFSDYNKLYSIIGIRSLSEAVRTDLIDKQVVQGEKTEYLTQHAKILILVWIYNKLSAVYQELMDGELAKYFLLTEEVLVKNLRVRFQLDAISLIDEIPAYWNKTEKCIYLNEISESPKIRKSEIAETLAKGFMGNRPFRDLQDYISLVLESSLDDLDRYLDERYWRIPEEISNLLSEIQQKATEVSAQDNNKTKDNDSVANEEGISQDQPEVAANDPEECGPEEVQSTINTESDTKTEGIQGHHPSRQVNRSSSDQSEDTANESEEYGPESVELTTNNESNTKTDVRQERHPSRQVNSGSSDVFNSPQKADNNNNDGSSEDNVSTDKSFNNERQPQHANRDRLISYVHPKTSITDTHEERSSEQEQMEISKAAVKRVLDYEIAEGRYPTEMAHSNPGYDIISKSADDKILRYIEIKGIEGYWTARGVPLSSTQFSFGQNYANMFWLYVVENARSDNYKIWTIQNPIEKVTEFRFDNGWQQVSETKIKSDSPEPKVGMGIETENGQIGEIMSVRGSNILKKLRVKYEDGQEAEIIFKPNITKVYELDKKE